MFSVSLFNGAVETVIHFPSADSSDPHLLNLPLKESLSQAEQLSFSMPFGNPGYYIMEGLISRVKVIDTRDDSVIFSGRVLNTKEGMGSDGSFINQVICEGALNYLVDSQTRRWNFTNNTPFEIIEWLLNTHNAKVEANKQIQVGTIQLTQPITLDTNYETTLNTIITKIRNILGGDISVRETAGVLYLDYLTAQGANNEVAIQIGVNAKQMIREYDPTDVTTRAIPLGYGEGINQLDITSANGGIEYIEDVTANAKYGVIEQTVINKDIQNAATLKIYGQTVLAEKKQPKLIIDTAMVDRSVLEQYNLEKYRLGDTLHIVDYDVYARVIERDRDLILSPWEPTQVISTRPITLSEQMVDLRQRSSTLEQSPQGNTVIFPIQAQENADATHPITLDLDIPQEAININRVYLNLHGRKYRAYETATASAGASTETSTSGGGSTATSTSGGSATPSSAASSAATTEASNTSTTSGGEGPHSHWKETDPPDPDKTGNAVIQHNHNMPHTHNMPHNHTVTILAHAHDVVIPFHDHGLTIPGHSHAITYGIYESTHPKNSKIKVNGVDIGLNFGDGLTPFDGYNLDITPHISIGNNKIEISTEQNGRLEITCYSQIFIQSK